MARHSIPDIPRSSALTRPVGLTFATDHRPSGNEVRSGVSDGGYARAVSDPTRTGSAGAEREGPAWKRWGLVVLIVLFLIVIFQNSQETTVNLLFFSTTMPLIIVLVLAAVVGALIGYLFPMIRGRQRSSRNRD